MAYLVRMVGDTMEMITLLKANIRHKKGSFVSVILLTMIVAMSVTIVLSIKESSVQGVLNSHELTDTPDLWVEYYAHKLTAQMLEEVNKHPQVAKVVVRDTLVGEKTIMKGGVYTNSILLMTAPTNTKLLNEDLSGVKENVDTLDQGEIYVSQGLLTSIHGKVGESLTIETIAGDYQFKVKGVLLDSMLGSSVIGWKKYYISDGDYNKIAKAIAAKETEEIHATGKILEIFKADHCRLTDAKFRRQLNLDTDILNMGFGSLTKDMSIHYTTLFPKIISSILMVFILLLLGIVLIVVVHSITMEMESNYLTFGILKAQGFGTNRLRTLFLFQYFIAEVVGTILGILFALPLIKAAANIFAPITGIPTVTSVPIFSMAGILMLLFLLSALSIFGVTGKLRGITPVRAISGVKKEIYFDSRMNVPIGKKFLSGSLALRQFTAAKRRYFGVFMIVAILVFFMMTITMLSNTVTSKSALESMGTVISEVDVSPKKEITKEEFARIEKEIERYTKIKKRYYWKHLYFSFDGEEMMGNVFENPQALSAMKGRMPIYDNEIAVSPSLLDEFNLHIGDEVTIGWEDRKERYLISGTAPLMYDAGRCFLISAEGARKLGCDLWLWGSYSLEDEGEKDKIKASLNDKFGDIIEAGVNEEMLDDIFQIAIDAMQLIIYAFSLIFSLVVVQMVCSKAFIGERKDIGIYKSLGFTCVKLRFQFAIRYLIVALLGSLLGSAICYVLSGKMLTVLLYEAGISNFQTRFGIMTFIIPVAVICVSFFFFSYLVSGKIKKVEVRELVAE